MTPVTTSAEVYEHYRALCAGAPVLREAELRLEIQAAGLRYEDVDDTFGRRCSAAPTIATWPSPAADAAA